MEILAGIAIGFTGGFILVCLIALLQRFRETLGKLPLLLLSFVGIVGTGFISIWANQYLVDNTTLGKGHTLTATWVLLYACTCIVLAIRNVRQNR